MRKSDKLALFGKAAVGHRSSLVKTERFSTWQRAAGQRPALRSQLTIIFNRTPHSPFRSTLGGGNPKLAPVAESFKYTQRVVYAHCTVGNHVYYARYLDFLETARGEFFRSVGSPLLQLQEAGTFFPVIGLELSYKGMARYDDLLTVELWVSELGGARLNFSSRILNEAGKLLVEGRTLHVCAGEQEKPKRLPPELIEKLQPFLHTTAHAT